MPIKKIKDNIEEIDIDNEDIMIEEDGINSQIKKLKTQLKNCQKESKEYLDGWQRSKADFVNAQKENEKRNKLISSIVKEDILRDILPAIDSFEMAFSNKEKWQEVDESWRIGVEYIYSQLLTILEKYGLKEIENKDKIFNPEIHSVLEVVEIDKKEEDGEVVKVLQKGYKLDDKILRLVKIKIKKFNK